MAELSKQKVHINLSCVIKHGYRKAHLAVFMSTTIPVFVTVSILNSDVFLCGDFLWYLWFFSKHQQLKLLFPAAVLICRCCLCPFIQMLFAQSTAVMVLQKSVMIYSCLAAQHHTATHSLPSPGGENQKGKKTLVGWDKSSLTKLKQNQTKTNQPNKQKTTKKREKTTLKPKKNNKLMPSQFLSQGSPCQPLSPWFDCWAWHHMLWEIPLDNGGQLPRCVPLQPPVHPQPAGVCWQSSVQRREAFVSYFQLPKTSLSTSRPFPHSHEQAPDGHSFGQLWLCFWAGWNGLWPKWGSCCLQKLLLQPSHFKPLPQKPGPRHWRNHSDVRSIFSQRADALERLPGPGTEQLLGHSARSSVCQCSCSMALAMTSMEG